jgi:hypothetical protein
MLTLLLLELLTSSLFLVLLPFLVLVLAVPAVYPAALTWPGTAPVYDTVAAHMSLQVLLFGVAGADLVLTCLVALIERRARFVALWFFFPFLRVLDAVIALYVLPLAWLKSTGRWTSPTRRLVEAQQPALADQVLGDKMTLSSARAAD